MSPVVALLIISIEMAAIGWMVGRIEVLGNPKEVFRAQRAYYFAMMIAFFGVGKTWFS